MAEQHLKIQHKNNFKVTFYKSVHSHLKIFLDQHLFLVIFSSLETFISVYELEGIRN